MNSFRITPGIWLTFGISGFILLLGLFPSVSEPLLQFDRERVVAGEWWRLLTGQLVHYGSYHLAMNLAALLLCGYVFLYSSSPTTYGLLLLTLAVWVGAGIYWGNPELGFYAGFSGILHGIIVYGLLLTLRQTPWFNTAGLILVLAKLWQEQSGDYQATDLQQLLPVPVAVDAHLYGALGGLLFSATFFAVQWFKREEVRRKSSQ